MQLCSDRFNSLFSCLPTTMYSILCGSTTDRSSVSTAVPVNLVSAKAFMLSAEVLPTRMTPFDPDSKGCCIKFYLTFQSTRLPDPSNGTASTECLCNLSATTVCWTIWTTAISGGASTNSIEHANCLCDSSGKQPETCLLCIPPVFRRLINCLPSHYPLLTPLV